MKRKVGGGNFKRAKYSYTIRDKEYTHNEDFPFQGLSLKEIEGLLKINPCDIHQPQLSDMNMGGYVIPHRPKASNTVVVGTPIGESNVAVNLTAVALDGKVFINEHRFAAVKRTGGEPSEGILVDRVKMLKKTPTMLRDQLQKDSAEKNKQTPLYDLLLRQWVTDTATEEESKHDQQMLFSCKSRVTVLLFGTARTVCTGSNTALQAVEKILNIVQVMRKVHPELPNPRHEVQNIVASVQLFPKLDKRADTSAYEHSSAVLNGAPDRSNLDETTGEKKTDAANEEDGLPLHLLAEEFGLGANYTKSLFPGAIIRFEHQDTQLCFLVFRGGACVITGAKDERVLCRVYRAFLWAVTVYLLEICAKPENKAYRHVARCVPAYLRKLVRQEKEHRRLDPNRPPVQAVYTQ